MSWTCSMFSADIMFPLLLLVVTFIFSWYYWRKYSPYLSFPTYSWLNWKNILESLQVKGSEQKSINIMVFEEMVEASKKHMPEGLFLVWAPKPSLIIYSAESVKFFSNEPSMTDKPMWVYKFFEFFIKNGILCSNGKRMKKMKKLISRAFFPGMMKNYTRAMIDHASYLVNELSQLENNTANDLNEIIKTRTFMLFFEAALGIKTDFAKNDSRINVFIKSMVPLLKSIVYRTFRPWLHMDFMLHFFSDGRDYLKKGKQLHMVAQELITHMKESYSVRFQSTNSKNTDAHLYEQHYKSFGDILIEEHLKNPSDVTLKDVRTELITLIAAGFDTASHSLSWSLWLLGLHRDVQEKAYEEIQSNTDEVIQYEDIRKLTYLECVIKESLRLYPPVPIYSRQCNTDLQFGKYKIPRGTAVSFFSYMLHRNPELYPDPESFYPERFSENETNVNPWAFIPFAEGVRSCIGKNYAMLEMKIFLAIVLRSFKIISLTQREDIELSWEVMLKSATPLSVQFIPR